MTKNTIKSLSPYQRDGVSSKALIKVGYACNNRCVFCHAEGHKGTAKLDTIHLMQKISWVAGRSFDMVTFSGGEPTVRIDFVELCKYTSRLGLSIGIVSNGRKLADKDLVRQLHKLGLRYAYISLLGPTKAIHDELAGVESFEEQFSALQNLNYYSDIDLTCNIVVCKQNIEHLKAIIDLFSNFPKLKIKFSLIEPKQAVLAYGFEKLVPPVEKVADKVMEAIEYGEQLSASIDKLVFGFGEIPVCLVGEEAYRRYNDNLLTNGIYYMSEAFEDRFFHVDERNKANLPICEGCLYLKRCPGIFRGYGAKEVKLNPLK